MSINTARAIALQRDITIKLNQYREAYTPFYPTLCNLMQSDGASENYAFPGMVGGMREWLSERDFKNITAARFSITNRKWESSIAFEKDDIEDDRLVFLDLSARDLAVEAESHPDELLFELVINGESTACWDGQYFFDTDHSWQDSGTQDNDLTYTAATSTTPTEAEFRGAFHQALNAMLRFKGPNGKYFNRPTLKRVDDLLLVVPPELNEVANQAIKKTLVAGGETNIVLSDATIIPCPHLTDAAKFYMFRTNQAWKPFIFQKRQSLRSYMKGWEDGEAKDVKYMVDARYNLGYLAWWNAVLTTFT